MLEIEILELYRLTTRSCNSLYRRVNNLSVCPSVCLSFACFLCVPCYCCPILLLHQCLILAVPLSLCLSVCSLCALVVYSRLFLIFNNYVIALNCTDLV